jgi:hypothetical protein
MIAKVLKYAGLAVWGLGVAKDLIGVIKEVEHKIHPGDDGKVDKIIKKADKVVKEIDDLLGMIKPGE